MIRKIFILALALAFVATASVWAIDRSKLQRTVGATKAPGQEQPSSGIDTEVLLQYDCNATFLYPVPDGIGDTYEGMRFDVPATPAQSNLKKIVIDLLNNFPQVNDTINSLRLVVFGNVGGGPCPGVPDSTNVLLDMTIPNATLVGASWPENTIKTFTITVPTGITFNAGQSFHIMAMTAPGDLGANLLLLDDGSCTPGQKHWTEWGPGCPCPTPFHVVDDCFPGNDLNLNIRAIMAPIHNNVPVVPSLTTYGLIVLALLLAGTAVWMFRKRLAMGKGGVA